MSLNKSILPMEVYKYAFQMSNANKDGIIFDTDIDRLFSLMDFEMPENVENAFRKNLMDPKRGDLVGKCTFKVGNYFVIAISVYVKYYM